MKTFGRVLTAMVTSFNSESLKNVVIKVQLLPMLVLMIQNLP